MQAAVDHVNASSLSAEEKNALLARLVVPPKIDFADFLALPDSAMRALIPTAGVYLFSHGLCSLRIAIIL